MLQKLIIKNYAIIDHLTIEPDAHLNTVTGETGAGKSIIVGALSLILGERADTSVLINKNEKCVLEAYFDVANNKSFQAALKEEELDEENICIIRREIAVSGKSRAFINDTPVTLNVLGKLTPFLVDLHQQFAHLELGDDNFQIDVLDAVAKNGELKKRYEQLYRQYEKLHHQLSVHKQQQANWQKEADYKQFLFDELIQAGFKENEIEDAEQQLKQMNNAERIVSILQASRYVLDEGELPIVNELKKISQQLQNINDVMPEINATQQRISSVWAEVKDIASELEHLEGKVIFDQKLMEELQQKVDIGYKLLKKHGVSTTRDLLHIQSQLAQELSATLNLNETIDQLTQQLEQLKKQLIDVGENLSAARKKIVPDIVIKINNLLTLVGMPNARFSILINKLQQPAITGIDDVQFLLDANKSGQMQPIHKAASGGEMSRIMLCLKSLIAKAIHLPTLIFDEVDTGISGEAARQVGILLQDLSNYHQIICITHQPQVAARGTKHFYVFKDADNDGRITTKVRVLKQDERILAIARMIGGEKPSEAAIQNARELVIA